MKRSIKFVGVVMVGVPIGTYAMLWAWAGIARLLDVHGACARFSGMC